ncbi:methyl-accepting chemotaxis protein [Desulfovibrio legallii]|uniref:Methyl-accepting chemotaxis sensory transducer with Cache sensor n=1 Tax=Desulfovibrio legallii TaxID=571438 RepID=A0A1G7QN66_9BACT|nr:methyl-accepting chemotaxis protein [Desulfovibrio legallii]SDF99319.1 methyl-accepting chemotaxis sensory transducer with Cache sensor [Desulfovibrio legallii]
MSHSIRMALLLAISVVVLFVQSSLIGVVAKLSYEANVDARTHEMGLVVETIAKSMGDFGEQLSTLVNGAAKTPQVRHYLETGEGGEGVGGFIAAMSQSSASINTLYVFDATGQQQVVTTQGKLVEKHSNLAHREYVRAALDGKPGFSTTPTKSFVTGKIIVSVTAPVLDKAGKVLGGIGMSYAIDELEKNYIKSVKIGQTGYPYIVSPKGIFVAHPDSSLALQDRSDKPGVREMLAAPSGQGVPYVRKGEANMLSWATVPHWGWRVGLTMDMDEIQAPARQQRNVMLGLGAGAIVLLVCISLWALEKVVIRPLHQLEAYAGVVAGGDLNASLDLRLKNEIGKLADALRTMVANLKAKIAEADENTRKAQEESERAAQATAEAETARAAAERAKAEGMLQAADQLEGVVTTVSTASEQLSAQVEQSSRGAERQSARASETATAMEEMNATVMEVARNAAEAADSAKTAKTKAADGAGVVAQVVDGIGHLREQALGLKDEMTVLGQQAESIGQILGVISDIADQTNLLALNAAIEAARAGEAGRGFAVVADEVRKLAEKTMTATKQVGDAIHEIQSGTRKNVDNVEQVVEVVVSTTDLAGKSGAALHEIVSLVDATAQQVQSIATAAEEQSAASEEINHSIEDVNRVSAETAEAMRHAAGSVSDMARQAQVLRDLIEQMKRG